MHWKASAAEAAKRATIIRATNASNTEQVFMPFTQSVHSQLLSLSLSLSPAWIAIAIAPSTVTADYHSSKWSALRAEVATHSLTPPLTSILDTVHTFGVQRMNSLTHSLAVATGSRSASTQCRQHTTTPHSLVDHPLPHGHNQGLLAPPQSRWLSLRRRWGDSGCVCARFTIAAVGQPTLSPSLL